jgi:hypothetical protein
LQFLARDLEHLVAELVELTGERAQEKVELGFRRAKDVDEILAGEKGV